ncbi:DUF2441 domain-containing protein [Bacteroides reticulotermitis]|uniref:DUF2441 domain-containing protein n=1 Tax=Bacteroides reticulotermitis TaxID=1133319 RepID=UPI003A8BC430
MEVKNFKAYHLKKVEEENNYDIGQFIIEKKRRLSDFTSPKIEIETAFENIRKNKYPTLLSRLSALFVCPDEENVKTWAYYKYGRQKIEYYVFELSLTGNLYWVDACHYNESFIDNTNLDYEKAANLYWTSESNKHVVKNYEAEGLFTGRAEVISIVKKMNSR